MKFQIGDKYHRRLILSVLSLLLLLLLCEAFRPQNHPLAGTKAVQQPAAFSVATRGVSIILTNNNDFDWTDVRITIKEAGESYYLQAGTIYQGDTRGFLLSAFTTGGGKPLNYIDTKPAAVSVVSREAQGTAQLN